MLADLVPVWRYKSMNTADAAAGGVFRESADLPPAADAPDGSAADTNHPILADIAEAAVGLLGEGPQGREKGAYASTQIDLSHAVGEQFAALCAAVRPEDMADKGCERWPHVTCLWGLHSADPEPVRKAAAGFGPVEFTFGPFGAFEGCEDGTCDVLYLSVVSPALVRLHHQLAQLPHHATHPEYVPHATVCYLKPGLGAVYAAAFNGVAHPVGGGVATDLTFSDQDKRQTKIPLVDVVAADGSTSPNWPRPLSEGDGVLAGQVVVGEAVREKGGDPVADLLAAATEDDLNGLRVYRHPDGPVYWVDQMDWHESGLGQRVIAAAEAATGTEKRELTGDEASSGEVATGEPAVLVMNEGPSPQGDGWADLIPDVREKGKPWDESKHKRDRGRFSSTGGAKGAAKPPAGKGKTPSKPQAGKGETPAPPKSVNQAKKPPKDTAPHRVHYSTAKGDHTADVEVPHGTDLEAFGKAFGKQLGAKVHKVEPIGGETGGDGSIKADDIPGVFGGMAGAIRENWHKGIADALAKTGEVPSPERSSFVGQAWGLVKGKFGNTPEAQQKFLAAVKAVKENTSDGWKSALNQAFGGAGKTLPSAPTTPRAGQTPKPPVAKLLPPVAQKKVTAAAKPIAAKVAKDQSARAVLARADKWAAHVAAQHAHRVAHRFGGDAKRAEKVLATLIRSLAHAAYHGGRPATASVAGLGLSVRKKGFEDDAFDPSLYDDAVFGDPAAPADPTPAEPPADPEACPACGGHGVPVRSLHYSLSCERCGTKYLLSKWAAEKGYPPQMPLGVHVVTNHAGRFVRFAPFPAETPADVVAV